MEPGPEVKCLRLAATQHGVVSRTQAKQCGVSARQIEARLASGRWQRVMPAVYRVEGSPPTWRQQLKAASLWAGSGFAISHHAAAALWGFARYPEGPLELTLTRFSRAPAGVVLHQVDVLEPRALASLDRLRVTTVERTLLDLASCDPAEQVRAACDEAMRRKWTNAERLSVAIERAGRRPGLALVRALVDGYLGGQGPTESELEAHVVELLEACGLPAPIRQARVVVGGRVRRLDFRIPGSRVVIEADGYAWHSSPEAFERDRQRNNALIARGFRVLHWTWRALCDEPHALVAQLHAVLSADSVQHLHP